MLSTPGFNGHVKPEFLQASGSGNGKGSHSPISAWTLDVSFWATSVGVNLIEIVAFWPRCIWHGNAVHGSTLTVSIEAVGFRPREGSFIIKYTAVCYFCWFLLFIKDQSIYWGRKNNDCKYIINSRIVKSRNIS